MKKNIYIMKNSYVFCIDCGYFRKPINSKLSSFCALTGEKVNYKEIACHFFTLEKLGVYRNAR